MFYTVLLLRPDMPPIVMPYSDRKAFNAAIAMYKETGWEWASAIDRDHHAIAALTATPDPE
jgi:hypothetical protein